VLLAVFQQRRDITEHRSGGGLHRRLGLTILIGASNSPAVVVRSPTLILEFRGEHCMPALPGLDLQVLMPGWCTFCLAVVDCPRYPYPVPHHRTSARSGYGHEAIEDKGCAYLRGRRVIGVDESRLVLSGPYRSIHTNPDSVQACWGPWCDRTTWPLVRSSRVKESRSPEIAPAHRQGSTRVSDKGSLAMSGRAVVTRNRV